MNVNVESDGRWVLGNPVGKCPKCGAPAAVKYTATAASDAKPPGKPPATSAPTDPRHPEHPPSARRLGGLTNPG